MVSVKILAQTGTSGDKLPGKSAAAPHRWGETGTNAFDLGCDVTHEAIADLLTLVNPTLEEFLQSLKAPADQ